MIQCPSCAGLSVSEVRVIPPPSGEIKGWVKAILWPFRMPGLAMVTTLVVLVALGSMAWLSESARRADLDPDTVPGMAACGATALIGLYILAMTKLPGFIVSRVLPLLGASKPAIAKFHRFYQRSCSDCGFRWTWNPEDPEVPDSVHPSPEIDARPKADPTGNAAPSGGHVPGAVPFICPDCGYQSSFDPWSGPAHCPNCDYSPGQGKSMRRVLKRVRLQSSTPYLEDYLRHWHGNPLTPGPFELSTPDDHVASFQAYQKALGEVLPPTPGQYYASGYFRKYFPTRREILDFMSAYGLLQQGEMDQAREALSRLHHQSPEFAEPALWLAVVSKDPMDRQRYLRTASLLEPSHPLILDLCAILMGQVSIPWRASNADSVPRLEAQRCEHCGGELHYQAGASEVECGYCGSRIRLRPRARPWQTEHSVSALRLQRKLRGQAWKQIDRVLSCQACGARLTMAAHLARVCGHCGSPNVLIEDFKAALEQPDGFVPFRINQKAAGGLIRGRRPSIWWDWKSWRRFRGMHIDRLLGIYIPYWVFDGTVEPIWARMHQDGRISKEHGPGTAKSVDNLMLPASNRPVPSLLDEVSSFDLRQAVVYEPELLAEWPALLYDIDVELAVEDAYDMMITVALEAMGPPVVIGGEQPPSGRMVRSLQVSRTTYQLMLLPMWIASLSGDLALCTALVNGQTGDVVSKMVYRS